MKTASKYFLLLDPYARTVSKNASHLVESVALLIVAYYAYTNAYKGLSNNHYLRIVIAASVVIGLRGAYEFLQYLSEKES